jgi:hypothetical protein
MSVDDMNKVAQGRVWTGRQAYDRGLVDRIGGLWTAVSLAASMSDIPLSKNIITTYPPTGLKVQTLREFRRGFALPFLPGSSLSSRDDKDISGPLLLCDDTIVGTGLVGFDSLGISPFIKSFGVGPVMSYLIRHSTQGQSILSTITTLPSIAPSLMAIFEKWMY